MAANTIPSVDLKEFLSDDPAEKQKFVREIGTAFEEIGFVALGGHFLSHQLVQELYSQIKAFFDLPQAVKDTYAVPGGGGQRGYTSFGKEHAKGRTVGDLKEFWHFGQYLEEGSRFQGEYPGNVRVAELPRFNEVGKEVYMLLEKTAQYVLRALALHLKLEETYFDGFIKEGNSILRPIHYPPITAEPKEAVRAAAHGDINLITLLMGAHGKGLQVQNHEGQWIDAIAAPDQLMINVGDMLSRHTNNKLKSTIHKVVNPPRELWGSSRYSIPFFMHPVSEMPLNCLEHCVDVDHPILFEDITAGEFLNERLVELGLLKK
ncbi:MAG: 2-oxoglutarate and iron-dependent oxygenase domain-containing protein [Bacteroidota bacterium]